MTFERLLTKIEELGSVADSPRLSDVRSIAIQVSNAYLQLTTAQMDHVDKVLTSTLVGKCVTWALTVSNVNTSPHWVAGLSSPDTGVWIEHSEYHEGIFLIECHTEDPRARFLSKGQAVVVNGCITSISRSSGNVDVRLGDTNLPEVHLGVRGKKTGTLETRRSSSRPAARQRPSTTRAFSKGLPALDASYQTAPLEQYSPRLQRVAERIFGLLRERISGSQARKHEGSYSIIGTSTKETVAKVVIYEAGLGKRNGLWPDFDDGVHVLVRANGLASKTIWGEIVPRQEPELGARMNRGVTIGIAPRHHRRFAYFRVKPGERLEDIADMLSALSKV